MIIRLSSIKIIKEKTFSNIKKFFSIKIVLIIIQKNATNITLGVSKINCFLYILLLNKEQLNANIANGTQEPNGAITTIGQINNEIIIKIL